MMVFPALLPYLLKKKEGSHENACFQQQPRAPRDSSRRWERTQGQPPRLVWEVVQTPGREDLPLLSALTLLHPSYSTPTPHSSLRPSPLRLS